MDISDVKTNRMLYLAIPINLLLWGSETWALKDSDWKGISYQESKFCIFNIVNNNGSRL